MTEVVPGTDGVVERLGDDEKFAVVKRSMDELLEANADLNKVIVGLEAAKTTARVRDEESNDNIILFDQFVGEIHVLSFITVYTPTWMLLITLSLSTPLAILVIVAGTWAIVFTFVITVLMYRRFPPGIITSGILITTMLFAHQ